MLKFSLNKNILNFLKVSVRQISKMESKEKGCTLKEVINKLENFAPLSLAEKWDNVGLLIEPYENRSIQTIFLTNDLTVKVMEEAIERKSDMIISYHPPIFAPLKRITQDNWKARIVSMCLAKGIALYSPHTAWDSANEGVNDWLAKAIGPCDNIQPIMMDPVTKNGPGRKGTCSSPVSLKITIENVQNYIGLPVHVAMGVDHSLNTSMNKFAVCAGSGASLLKEVDTTDVFLTGEMSHHELLDAQHRNITVILCNHSNTERGFLKHFSQKLNKLCNNVCQVIVSETDRDPLTTFVKKD